MKTKELIKRLQENDPSGEEECCVDGLDIHFITTEPAYWDGCMQVLDRDPSNENYNIIGAKYVGTGRKVVIKTISIREAIFENVDLPVEYVGLSEFSKERYQKNVADYRKETNDINNNIERDHFVSYMKERLIGSIEDLSDDEIAWATSNFFNQNMSYQDEIPEYVSKLTENHPVNSYNYRRKVQWDHEITVEFVDNILMFKRLPIKDQILVVS